MGRSVELGGEPVPLGRAAGTFGEGALEGPHLSRAHAVVEPARGQPQLRDLGSHNGTFVNGTRVQQHELVAGDVIALGRVLLLVVHEPPPPSVSTPVGMVGHSHGFLAALATVGKAARYGPTLLWGETGTGKSTLAEQLHAVSGRTGSSRRLACGAAGPAGASPSLHALLAEAGTLVLDNVEELRPQEQLVLLDALAQPRTDGPGIVACTVQSPEALGSHLRPELVHRLSRWTIDVPPLVERRADIVPLAMAFALRFGETAAVRLSAELSYRLLRHRWPGNLHELEAVIERAVVEARDDRLTVFDALDGILALPLSSLAISRYGRSAQTDPFVLHTSGQWYRLPDGTRHDLERRKTLGRVLATLVRARQQSPGQALSVKQLLSRAWPGEQLLARAGANRVYVAMTSLRKMGLRDVLLRTDAGYLLDPDMPLRVEE